MKNKLASLSLLAFFLILEIKKRVFFLLIFKIGEYKFLDNLSVNFIQHNINVEKSIIFFLSFS